MKKKPKIKFMSIRLSDQQYRFLKFLAQQQNLNISQFIREEILKDLLRGID